MKENKVELKIGMKLKVKETWNDCIKGKHYVEDIVTILKLNEDKVTFHSDYLGNKPISVPIKNFWSGVEFIEMIS
jgi:transcription elongation factor